MVSPARSLNKAALDDLDGNLPRSTLSALLRLTAM